MATSKALHPFPARMAPDLAIDAIRELATGHRVLDPMAGSGTVLREANRRGHPARGFDVDPLAILISCVQTTPVSDRQVEDVGREILAAAKRSTRTSVPWIDSDPETAAFVDYWFAEKQRHALARLSWSIAKYAQAHLRSAAAVNAVRIALSRIIITKESGASLARDVSHSRPHRVATRSSYDVFGGFEASVAHVRRVLRDDPPLSGTLVTLGDVRRIRIASGSVDLLLTSPPYLNAIDYIRGHRLSLVWLGHSLPTLRAIRAAAIGAERVHDHVLGVSSDVAEVRDAMVSAKSLDGRLCGMVERYSSDLLQMMRQVSRVLSPGGCAVLVVGNSCLRGTFISNSKGVAAAGRKAGLTLVREVERELPESRRYLPLSRTQDRALAKRMRTENVLTFRH